jgi:hypothetical protein
VFVRMHIDICSISLVQVASAVPARSIFYVLTKHVASTLCWSECCCTGEVDPRPFTCVTRGRLQLEWSPPSCRFTHRHRQAVRRADGAGRPRSMPSTLSGRRSYLQLHPEGAGSKPWMLDRASLARALSALVVHRAIRNR